MNKKGKPLSLFEAFGKGMPFVRYIAGLTARTLIIANSYGRRTIQQPSKTGSHFISHNIMIERVAHSGSNAQQKI